jgi:hypothetical protein
MDNGVHNGFHEDPRFSGTSQATNKILFSSFIAHSTGLRETGL